MILTWNLVYKICLDIIQIKFDFYCVWPNISFSLNLLPRTFLYSFKMLTSNFRYVLYWHNTEQVSLLYPFIYSFGSYASFKFVGAGGGHVLLQKYLQNAFHSDYGFLSVKTYANKRTLLEDKKWWTMGSNQQPLYYSPNAFPTELRRKTCSVGFKLLLYSAIFE